MQKINLILTYDFDHLNMQEANRFDWWSKYFASVSGAGGAARVSRGEKVRQCALFIINFIIFFCLCFIIVSIITTDIQVHLGVEQVL